MTVKKITQKIVGFSVVAAESQNNDKNAQTEGTKETPPENTARPNGLPGATYKIKPPGEDHALYVTINDREVGGKMVPYEVFINSKNMNHYQWVTALTRVISAVFRKGGDNAFLADELMEVFDPKGGYFKSRQYMPSLVAEIGHAIKEHMLKNGSRVAHDVGDAIREKAKEAEESGAMKNATLCDKCHSKSVVMMGGCLTCVSCGASKCS